MPEIPIIDASAMSAGSAAALGGYAVVQMWPGMSCGPRILDGIRRFLPAYLLQTQVRSLSTGPDDPGPP